MEKAMKNALLRALFGIVGILTITTMGLWVAKEGNHHVEMDVIYTILHTSPEALYISDIDPHIFTPSEVVVVMENGKSEVFRVTSNSKREYKVL